MKESTAFCSLNTKNYVSEYYPYPGRNIIRIRVKYGYRQIRIRIIALMLTSRVKNQNLIAARGQYQMVVKLVFLIILHYELFILYIINVVSRWLYQMDVVNGTVGCWDSFT